MRQWNESHRKVKSKANSFEWKPFYGRKNFSASGVYLIRERGVFRRPVIYVGSSETNLYRTLYRHFQTWNDRRQERYTYSQNKYEVKVVLCPPKMALRLEARYIKALQPRDNKDKLEKLTNREREEEEKKALEMEKKYLSSTYQAVKEQYEKLPFGESA